MRTNNYLLKKIKASTNGIFLWGLILTSFLMNSCATKDIVRDWNSTEESKKNVESIMIMGLVNRVSLRSDIEHEMADVARKMGLKPTISMHMFPPELGKPFDDTERLKERLKEKGIDAILTVAIIDIKAERYVGPEKTYVPLVYYDQFTNYYHRTGTVVYKPGYFTLQTRYFLETNLYEVKNGKLIWSGRSYAFDPHDFEMFIPKYTKRLFKELNKTDILSIN